MRYGSLTIQCNKGQWIRKLIQVQPIAKNALTMLINLSADEEILKYLAEDDAFLETLLSKVTVCRCLASLPMR